MSTDVVIPRSEWDAASRLWKLLAHDETHRLGQIRLRCNGDRRRWYATDSVATVVVDGDHDAGVFDVGLSPALIEVAATTCRFNADVRLKIGQARPNPVVGLISPTTEMWVDNLRHDYPDIDATIPDESEWAARYTISVTELSALIGAVG